MKSIWGRFGITINLLDDEYNEIQKAFDESDSEIAEYIIRKCVTEGRYYFNGESYLPDNTVCEGNFEEEINIEL